MAISLISVLPKIQEVRSAFIIAYLYYVFCVVGESIVWSVTIINRLLLYHLPDLVGHGE